MSDVFVVVQRSRVSTGRAVARLAQAIILCRPNIQPRYYFFKVKMASPAILFCGITNPGQLVIIRPAVLQFFPRRDALGLIGKWALKIINGM